MGIKVVDPCFTKLPSYLITPLNLNESYDDVNTEMYLKKHCLQQQYEQNEKLCANCRVVFHIHQYKNKEYKERKSFIQIEAKVELETEIKNEDNTQKHKMKTMEPTSFFCCVMSCIDESVKTSLISKKKHEQKTSQKHSFSWRHIITKK
jgi:hypothetical protein